MEKRTRSRVVVIGLVAVMVASCQSAGQRLHEVSEGTGTPPETTLLASRVQSSQGSQDACHSTSLLELYGSSRAIDQIVEFYSTELTNRGWTEYSPPWLPDDVDGPYLLFRQGNSFQVGISEATTDVIDQFGDEAQATARAHATVYSVTWTFADAIARRNCPAWQSEPNKQP